MSHRERKVVVALGSPGMGKSALASKLINSYRATFGPESVRMLDPSGTFDDGEWPGRKGVDAWINELTADGEGPKGGGWGPGLLVLDDADRYLLPQSFDSFRDVWLANRHLGLDVIVTAHRAPAVPKDLLGSATELWLFAQEEPRALEYLAKIPALRATFDELADPLPTEPGLALRVVPRFRTVQLVNVFD